MKKAFHFIALFINTFILSAPLNSWAVQINGALTIPSDISGITYPTSYSSATSTTVDVIDPYCGISQTETSYPLSYLGTYPLPAQSGAVFPSSVKLGVILKDVWQVGNPTFNNGCVGDVRSAFLETVQRIRALGGSFVEITPWTFVDTSTATWQIVNPATLNTSTMNDADLEWAVATAHAAGLEVHWRNQIQGAVGSTIPAATIDNVTKFMTAYESYMLERAAFLQRINVDAMMIGCICWFFPQAETENIYTAGLSRLAPQIKAVFSGKLSTLKWGTFAFYADAQLMNSLDIVEIPLWTPNLTTTELQNVNVALLKTKFSEMVTSLSQQINSSKQIVWTMSAPSRSDYFTSTGYVEETFCTSDVNVIAQTGSACIQNQKQTDFSIQAMAYEAMLEALRDQTYFQTYGVTTDGYWLTSNLMPQSTFPNIAVSIRSKPAEALIRQWFNPWLNGVGVRQSDCLFNWAERTYPQYFSSIEAVSGTLSPYYYRYYSSTSNYLAISSIDSHVFLLGPISNGGLLDIGLMTGYLTTANCQ